MTLVLMPFLWTDISKLNVPEGFVIEEYVADIDNPRQMVEGANFIFIGTRSAGQVYAINKSDLNDVTVIVSDLDMPTGVALKDGDLYIAETDTIHIFKNVEKKLLSEEVLVSKIFFDDLPRKNMWNPLKKSWHGWKWIDFGPDGALYISEGVPCNVCDEDDQRYGTILRLNNGELDIFADGVRNSVGFDWHPETKEMYFTDNGRDWLGDNSPSCELNRLDVDGQFFGYPYKHASDVLDPEFGAINPGYNFVDPIFELGAHVAPTGIDFYEGTMFPQSMQHNLFIALHGSWNRTEKVGYKVIRVSIDAQGNVTEADDFITGWLNDGKVIGRPSAPLVLRDGSMLISDDKANVILRVTYNK